MKKLYLVTVTPEPFEMCVMAESEDAALDVAESNARSEFENIDRRFHADDAQLGADLTLQLIPDALTGSIPYGSTDDKTVSEILGGKA